MKITIKGKGSVNLSKNDFIASGGEGSVYSKASTAYKIYTDSKKMIPYSKIQELSTISDKKVIRPLDIILDNRNKPIGYTMRYLKNTHSLCQLFTKSFKTRNKLDPNTILDLIRGLQNTIQHIHDKNILIVDLNELNFLVEKKFKEVYCIDVDSYQTKNFPATAIMESIRDRHSKKFSEFSDWFSFGIISFQLFIGIHPYKGKHQSLRGMTLEDRMVDNLSVFNDNINVPKICPSFDIIPQVYRDWLLKMFEEGYRGKPPVDLHAVIQVVYKVKKVFGNDKFDIEEIKTLKEYFSEFYSYEGNEVLSTDTDTFYVNKFQHKRKSSDSRIAFTPKQNFTVETYLKDDKIHHYNWTLKEDVKAGSGISKASELMGYQDRVYAMSGENVLEVQYLDNHSLLTSVNIVGKILEKSSKMYQGTVIQNLLGVYFASVFPEKGKCFQIKLGFLKDYRIVDAKFDGRILMVIGNKKGRYDKFIVRLDSAYEIIDHRTVDNISIMDINFVCLENGIVAHISEKHQKEFLELFSVSGNSIKEMESSVISADMTLCKKGTSVMFYKDKTLYSLKTK